MKQVTLAYIADGYLAAGALSAEAWGDEYFYGLKDEDGFETFSESLPDDLADKVMKQGTSDQVFSDGYAAANEVAKFLNQGSLAVL